MKVYIDFETRSPVDIKSAGVHVYSRHPQTDILCLAHAAEDGAVAVMESPNENNIDPLYTWAQDPDVLFYAHNSAFEQAIWKNIMVERYHFPEIPIERWRCTAAKAAAMSLPRSLKGVGEQLNLDIQKDDDGHAVMMKLARPRRGKFGGEVTFWEYDDCPEDFEKLYDYCKTDVETERLIDKALPDLNEREQQIWFLDQKINMRGVQLDVQTVELIMGYIEKTVKDLTDEFKGLVDGQLDSPNQVAAFLEWLRNHGCDLPDLQAATVDKRLANPLLDDEKCLRALQIRRALSKISTSKYKAMLARADSADDKMRDLFLYCAALTKRWGGRGFQPQNLPRGNVNSEVCIDHIKGGFDWFSALYPDPMGAYSSCIRGSIIASPGNELYVGDFSSIEAVTLPWLAGQQRTLDTFSTGEDLYCVEAAHTFGRLITKEDKYERQVGKVEVLALGYGGGVGAFGTMARGYGLDLRPAYDVIWPKATTEEQDKARVSYENYLKRCIKAGETDPLDRASGYASDVIKQRWRSANAEIVKFWYDLEYAANQAVLTGEKQTVGGNYFDALGPRPRITYGMWGEYLLCKLPSGTCLSYPFARVQEKETPWGQKKHTLTYRTEGTNYQFNRTHTYGGKLAENITQAVARDLLADAMLLLEAKGYPIVMHVHDEIVCDIPTRLSSSTKYFEKFMAEVPTWAEGCPIKVDAWKGVRYKK